MILAWIAISLVGQYLMARQGRDRAAHLRTGIMQGLGLAVLIYLYANPPAPAP